MLKFFQEQGGPAHGGNLFWPGTTEGFPFRGNVAPDLRQEEMQQIALALDFKSAMFCLWRAEDKAAFDDIMDRIVNGWFMQHKREDTWDPEHNHYRVWLEWVQIYGETPVGKHPTTGAAGRGANGNQQRPTTLQPGRPRSGPIPVDLLGG